MIQMMQGWFSRYRKKKTIMRIRKLFEYYGLDTSKITDWDIENCTAKLGEQMLSCGMTAGQAEATLETFGRILVGK